MKILYSGKDGGQESTCWGWWLVEIKSLFSVVLLKFEGQSRECFHTHAFTSVSWLLKGELSEEFLDGTKNVYKPSLLPIITRRQPFHKVSSSGNSWVFSLRGRWLDKWSEQTEQAGRYDLTHGRKVVECK